MEAGVGHRRHLLLVAAFTVLLHLPFLWQPVQGDEITYLDIAKHVLSEPLTPLNFQYVFLGHMADASGHPHPPLNGYLLALAWILRGHFSVLFFHAFYLLFALGIGFAAYALAARFTAAPLWAALLVAASPLVQVNTNTLAGPESPGLAFLLIGAAAFFWERFEIAGIALTLAALTELQALALPLILLLPYVLRRKRPPRAASLALAAPFLGLAAWQALQWGLTHRLPAAVLLGYAGARRFSGLALKGASALALLQHLGVLVTLVPLAWRRLWGLAPGLLAALLVHDYPWWERVLLVVFVALGVNALLWLWEARRIQPVLAGWCLLYFGFAVLVFFAGASRYLLPLVAPMALLFVVQFAHRRLWMAVALAVNVLLGLNISFAAYEFSRVYTEVAPPPGPAFLVNGEWGFRYYMLAQGGRVREENSVPFPGEWMVSSELSLATNCDSLAEEASVPLRTTDLSGSHASTPHRPLCSLGLFQRFRRPAALLVFTPPPRPDYVRPHFLLFGNARRLDAHAILEPPGLLARSRRGHPPPAGRAGDAPLRSLWTWPRAGGVPHLQAFRECDLRAKQTGRWGLVGGLLVTVARHKRSGLLGGRSPGTPRWMGRDGGRFRSACRARRVGSAHWRARPLVPPYGGPAQPPATALRLVWHRGWRLALDGPGGQRTVEVAAGPPPDFEPPALLSPRFHAPRRRARVGCRDAGWPAVDSGILLRAGRISGSEDRASRAVGFARRARGDKVEPRHAARGRGAARTGRRRPGPGFRRRAVTAPSRSILNRGDSNPCPVAAAV